MCNGKYCQHMIPWHTTLMLPLPLGEAWAILLDDRLGQGGDSGLPSWSDVNCAVFFAGGPSHPKQRRGKREICPLIQTAKWSLGRTVSRTPHFETYVCWGKTIWAIGQLNRPKPFSVPFGDLSFWAFLTTAAQLTCQRRRGGCVHRPGLAGRQPGGAPSPECQCKIVPSGVTSRMGHHCCFCAADLSVAACLHPPAAVRRRNSTCPHACLPLLALTTCPMPGLR